MPLEDKDHQGGTRLCISNEHQFVNLELTKIKRVDEEKYATTHINKGEDLLNRPKNHEPSPIGSSVGEEGRLL